MLTHDIDAILGAYHEDPFAVLGAHEVPTGGCELRAFLPQARRVIAVVDGAPAEMECIHADGVFEVALPARPARYHFQLELYDGSLIELEDPYRFPPILTAFDLHLHGEGTHYESYRTLGAHLCDCEGVAGVRFSVWAPSAQTVTVTADCNDWDIRRHPMRRRDGGIWELFIPGAHQGTRYKYFVRSRVDGLKELKSDPYAFHTEVPPLQASVVWSVDGYEWNDAEWMERRAAEPILERPLSVYEVHLESWMKSHDGTPLSYRELADKLVEYVRRLGFTHIELMPVMEHPFAGSWGYQVTGFFAPTSRFGTPQDFMFFVDACHQAGIGVIVDWVPAHFPKDAFGLARFDGTALYEHADPRQGEHLDWGTYIFNYGRNEVRTFLISNALFWLKQYHIDGLRVDAVASMLYLDYSREGGDWIPNEFGGRENLAAVSFLKKFNEQVHTVPGAMSIAEESTEFGAVTHPVYAGGLGFTMKWNMGWMHDMFRYFKQDPVHRKFHHNSITFSLLYAFTENFLLPISHDEVVHGKSSLIGKMPGDEWRRFANVRAFMGYMFGHPGKKLLFMGCEIGQYEEWNWQSQIRWELLSYSYHRQLQTLVAELNKLYRSEPALHEVDYSWSGFEWIDFHDVENSVIAFIRRAKDPSNYLVFVCNFTPLVRHHYHLGVPESCVFEEILNTDWEPYGGSNVWNGRLMAEPVQAHGRPARLSLTLPPLAVCVFRPVRQEQEL